MEIALTDLGFLLKSAQNGKKFTFLDKLKEGNSGRKLKNLTNDLIFSTTFSTLFVIFIFVFENSQNSFSCGPPFDPF